MDKQIYQDLVAIVGKENVFDGDAISKIFWGDGLRKHRAFSAYIPPYQRGFKPELLVRPNSTQQVAEIVRLARKAKLPIVPLGGGTGLMGGALPVKGGIELDLKNLNKILSINFEDREAQVQAGVILEDLSNRLEEKELILGHEPWSRPKATVGGAISTNGLGYFGAKYGSMGEQVIGLEVVLPDGNVLRTRAYERASTGFELKSLFIGTEGTFGIITEATVKVFPKPEAFLIRGFQFDNFERGYKAIVKLFEIGFKPAVIDFKESFETGIVSQLEGEEETTLYVALSGLKEEVLAQLKRLLEILKKFGARPLPQKLADEFWKTRHRAIDMYERMSDGTLIADALMENVKLDFIHVYLPQSKVLEYKARCTTILEKYGIRVLEFGLWNQPELFSILMVKPVEGDGRKATTEVAQGIDELLMMAQDMSGSMEYCHGVGIRLAHLMQREHGIGLEIMRKIKHSIDPDNIMNPGKMGLTVNEMNSDG